MPPDRLPLINPPSRRPRISPSLPPENAPPFHFPRICSGSCNQPPVTAAANPRRSIPGHFRGRDGKPRPASPTMPRQNCFAPFGRMACRTSRQYASHSVPRCEAESRLCFPLPRTRGCCLTCRPACRRRHTSGCPPLPRGTQPCARPAARFSLRQHLLCDREAAHRHAACDPANAPPAGASTAPARRASCPPPAPHSAARAVTRGLAP